MRDPAITLFLILFILASTVGITWFFAASYHPLHLSNNITLNTNLESDQQKEDTHWHLQSDVLNSLLQVSTVVENVNISNLWPQCEIHDNPTIKLSIEKDFSISPILPKGRSQTAHHHELFHNDYHNSPVDRENEWQHR